MNLYKAKNKKDIHLYSVKGWKLVHIYSQGMKMAGGGGGHMFSQGVKV